MKRLMAATEVTLHGRDYYVSRVRDGYYSRLGDTWVPPAVTLTPKDGGTDLELDADSEQWKVATVHDTGAYVDIRVG